MKFKKIITLNQETQKQFLSRTIWNIAWPHKSVLVFNNNKELYTPDILPDRIISYEEARSYMEMLEPEEKKIMQNRTIKEVKSAVEMELIEVTFELIGSEIHRKQWMNSVTGEIEHDITMR